MKISVIMAYFNNPGMLQRQYDMFRSYPEQTRDSIEYIVVDDCSDEDKRAYPPESFPVPLTIGRMQTKVRWNQDACRNWGASQAKFPWLLLTDIDHLIPPPTMVALVSEELRLSGDATYRFSRINDQTFDEYKPHPNSWLMTQEMYDHVGGYDERFAGIYGTDGDFLNRVSRAAGVRQLPHSLIRVGREHTPDASTPREYGRKTDRDGSLLRQLKEARGKEPPQRGRFKVDLVHRIP